MKIEKVSINGKVLSPASARISATDQGLMYGVNAFESLRVHDGKSFLIDEHFDRLARSLSALEIRWDDDRQKYYSWILDLCNNLPPDSDAFIRFVVTAGSKELWVSAEEYTNPNILIYRGNIPPFSPIAKEAAVLEKVRRATPEYFNNTGFRIKTMDYLSAKVAKMELKTKGKNIDGILLSPNGFIAEGLTSNVFWSKDGELYTPPLDIGILAGTVRAHLMATNKVTEVLSGIEELENADEIILTSGSSYLNPLALINGIKKPGTSGPTFKKLYAQLTEDIENLSKLVQPRPRI